MPTCVGIQWQPNLLVIPETPETPEKLIAVWTESAYINKGVYVSTLELGSNTWNNQRLGFCGDGSQPCDGVSASSHDPFLDGEFWWFFPTQNPIRLGSSRLLAPGTLQPRAVPAAVFDWCNDETEVFYSACTFWTRGKRAAALISDDDGLTWTLGGGTTQPDKSWAIWEPTLIERPSDDGVHVRMYVRNLDPRKPEDCTGTDVDQNGNGDCGGDSASKMLLTAESDDGGETWTDAIPVPVETISCRMHALPLDTHRWVMVHHDAKRSEAGTWGPNRSRVNIAWFASRTGEPHDWIAGNSLTGEEATVAYPQMALTPTHMHAIYSSGNWVRSIRTLSVPRPAAGFLHVFPRAVPGDPATIELTDEGWLRLFGRQRLLAGSVSSDHDASSGGFWIRRGEAHSVVLFDTRDASTGTGLLFSVRTQSDGYRPKLDVQEGSSAGTVTLWLWPNDCAAMSVTPNEWHDVGFSLQNTDYGLEARFVVDGHTCEVTSSGHADLPSSIAVIGRASLPNSSVSGFDGEIRAAWLAPGHMLSPEQHGVLYDAHASELGLPPVAADEPPTLPDDMQHLDAATFAGSEWEARLLQDPEPWHRALPLSPTMEPVPAGSIPHAYRVTGEASIAVELTTEHPTPLRSLAFAARVESLPPGGLVIATLGGADRFVTLRIGHASDGSARLFLAHGDEEESVAILAGWLTGQEVRFRLNWEVQDGQTTVVAVGQRLLPPPSIILSQQAMVSLTLQGALDPRAYLGPGYRTEPLPTAAGAFTVRVSSLVSRWGPFVLPIPM